MESIKFTEFLPLFLRPGDLCGQGGHYQSVLPRVLHAVGEEPDPNQTAAANIR